MPHRDKTILVVEDSRSINNILVSQIKQQIDIDAIGVHSLKEAQEVLEQPALAKKIFLAILDLNLPDAPKGEVVDYVLGKDINSIVLTSTHDEEVLNKILSKGVVDIVNKANVNNIQYVLDSAKRLYENFGRKVLVADDSEVSLMLIKALLERQNFKVLEAYDGVQALKLIKHHPDIDMVITDYNMPKMDGVELIHNIRQEYTRDELSIIGISSTNDHKISVRLLKAGANDFVARPFSHEEFYCRINHTIDFSSNYKKLREASIKDFLTGLYNRKYLFETGTKFYNNALRGNISLTLAMLDIDHFKAINDTYGHNVGDVAIRHTADLLKGSIREGDILARFGGEEFCILCINLDEDNAEKLFENIRKLIENNPIEAGGKTVSFTASLGYCSKLGDSLDHMINNADKALYKAKENGRNQVFSYKRMKQSV